MRRVIQQITVIAIIITNISPIYCSDEGDLYNFIDKHVLLINQSYNINIERGFGQGREALSCRSYIDILKIKLYLRLPIIDFSRDGKTLFAATKDNHVIAVDLRDGTLSTIAEFDGLGEVRVSCNGEYLGVVTNIGVSVIRIADKTMYASFELPSRNKICGIELLLGTHLIWNEASDQIVAYNHGGIWHYDLSKRVESVIERQIHNNRSYDDITCVFYYNERVHAIHHVYQIDDAGREIRETASWYVKCYDSKHENGKIVDILPNGWSPRNHYEIQAIIGTPYLICKLGYQKNIHGGAYRNNYIIDPHSGWHVLVSRSDNVMIVSVDNSREAYQLIGEQVNMIVNDP